MDKPNTPISADQIGGFDSSTGDSTADGSTDVASYHTGGGWYQLPDGSKVRGAEAAEAALNGTAPAPDNAPDTNGSDSNGSDSNRIVYGLADLFEEPTGTQYPVVTEGEHLVIADLTTPDTIESKDLMVVIKGLGVPYLVMPDDKAEARRQIAALAGPALAGKRIVVTGDATGALFFDGIKIGYVAPWTGYRPSEDYVVTTDTDGNKVRVQANLLPEVGKGGPVMLMLPRENLGGEYSVNGGRVRTFNRRRYGNYGGNFFDGVKKVYLLLTEAAQTDNAEEAEALRTQAQVLAKSFVAWLTLAYPAHFDLVKQGEDGVALSFDQDDAYAAAVAEELYAKINPKTTTIVEASTGAVFGMDTGSLFN